MESCEKRDTSSTANAVPLPLKGKACPTSVFCFAKATFSRGEKAFRADVVIGPYMVVVSYFGY